jgi:hypothetical protein
MNFAEYFLKGLKGTLRFNNGKNLSYKGPWIIVEGLTEIDRFYVGDFMAAEYTICVDNGNVEKEFIKSVVVAGPSQASITIYARTNIGGELIALSAEVNDSFVKLNAEPVLQEDSTLPTPKLIFSANYYYTINDLTSTI